MAQKYACRMHSRVKLEVRNGAGMIICNNVKINYNCIVVYRKHIEICQGTEFGPNVLIYDHDYSVRLKEEKFKESPVYIVKDCWIGANTVILRGTHIGDNCVVGIDYALKRSIP